MNVLDTMNILRKWRLIAAVTAITVGPTACGRLHRSGVAARPFCTAPLEGDAVAPTKWRTAGRAEHDSAATFEAAAQALRGTWDMLTVATQGVNEGPERWKLRMVIADSASRDPCLFPGCRLRTVRVVALGAPIGRRPFDSAAVTHAKEQLDRVEARYDNKTNHVTFHLSPQLLDGGAFYAVTEVSDSTIAGRWLDGSYFNSFVRRGNVTTLEHPQGFFCGRKSRENSSQ